MNARVAILVLAVLVVAMSAPVARIDILRHTLVAWTDEEVLIVVRVERHPENRALVVVAAEAGEIVRQSGIQLDGAHAMRTHWIRWRLPAGELTIRAVLCAERCDRPVASVTRRMTVLSRP